MTVQRVVRVDRSPMNDGIWVVQLECGHDVYVTQKTRPSLLRTWTVRATREKMCGPRYLKCAKCQ